MDWLPTEKVTRILLTLWLVLLIGLVARTLSADVIDVRLHYVGPTQGDAWLGVQQGLNEANMQGEFLGQKYSMQSVTAEQLDQLESVTVLLVAANPAEVLSIAKSAKFADVPVLNIASDDDELRSACLPNLFNIPASNRMKQDALAQLLNKQPDSIAHPQGWHKTFKKFAASQLNIRFKKAWGVVMNDYSWAGWAAVKLLSDTVARIQTTDSAIMLDYLKDDIAFDGQKGDSATFRDTGQLRQIVLLIENDKIVAEAPLSGVQGGLDSLGLASCK